MKYSGSYSLPHWMELHIRSFKKNKAFHVTTGEHEKKDTARPLVGTRRGVAGRGGESNYTGRQTHLFFSNKGMVGRVVGRWAKWWHGKMKNSPPHVCTIHGAQKDPDMDQRSLQHRNTTRFRATSTKDTRSQRPNTTDRNCVRRRTPVLQYKRICRRPTRPFPSSPGATHDSLFRKTHTHTQVLAALDI